MQGRGLLMHPLSFQGQAKSTAQGNIVSVSWCRGGRAAPLVGAEGVGGFAAQKEAGWRCRL